MDLMEQLEAVRRSVREDERDGQPTRVVVAAQEYPSGVDDVWDAVTNPDRLPRWFLPVSGDLTPGGRYQFQGNAGGEVLACDKPERVLVTWEFGDAVTWLELTLTDLGGRTRLQLEHVAPLVDQWFEYGPGAVGVGWDLAFFGLANHLAGGPELNGLSEDVMTTTPEGRAFVAGCSEGWGDANIAAGAAPEAARAAQDRTTAFYTGA